MTPFMQSEDEGFETQVHKPTRNSNDEEKAGSISLTNNIDDIVPVLQRCKYPKGKM